MHLFWECDKVKVVWTKLNEIINVTISKGNAIFNNVNGNPKIVENMLILIVKHYIFPTRCLKENICTTTMVNYMKKYKEIEGEIAKPKNKIIFHEIKWSDIKL